jgi:GTP pyrophosphokinase
VIGQGREILEKELRRLGEDNFNHEVLARKLGYGKPDELYYVLGTGELHNQQVAAKVLEQEIPAEEDEALPARAPEGDRRSEDISVLGTQGLLTNMARCCNPAPGDPITGYVTRGRGVTIHRRDCPNVLRKREPERFIRVSWGQAKKTYPVVVQITAYNRDGLIRDVATVVASEHINMTSANGHAEKDGMASFQVTMEIWDVEVLSRVLARIEQLPNVVEARRWKAG